MRYWRNSIDVLEPERAIIGGPRPVFFASQGEASRGEPCRGKVRLLFWLGYQELNFKHRPISKNHSLGAAEGKP